jgi:DNA-binding transcriptional LysR family regulator
MDVRVLRYFVAVVEAGSLSRAADVAGITQPSLSRQIHRLEEELQVLLFERDGRRLVPTSAGRRFLPIATDVVSKVDEAHRAMRELGSKGRLLLTLAANVTTLNDIVAPFAATLRADIVLDLRGEPTMTLYDIVQRGEADLAVAAVPSTGDLTARLVARFPLFACVPRGHRWSDRLQISLEELLDQPLVHLDHGSAGRRLFDHAVAQYAGAYTVAFQVSLAQAAQALAAAGHGIAILTDEPRYGLHALPIHDASGPLTLPIFAAWDRSHYAHDRIESLVGELQSYCIRQFPRATSGHGIG